jgi:hypothetical protein
MLLVVASVTGGGVGNGTAEQGGTAAMLTMDASVTGGGVVNGNAELGGTAAKLWSCLQPRTCCSTAASLSTRNCSGAAFALATTLRPCWRAVERLSTCNQAVNTDCIRKLLSVSSTCNSPAASYLTTGYNNC